MAVIAVKYSGRGINIQQLAEEIALMMGGGGEGLEAVAPLRAVLDDRQWGQQRRWQEGEHSMAVHSWYLRRLGHGPGGYA
jgi:hypothetical protein